MIKRLRTNDILFNSINGIIMFIVIIITFYPFIYMIFLSFSSGNVYGKILMYPINFSTLSYELMINKVKFLEYTLISVCRSLIGPTLAILVTYMGAFVLSKKKLVGYKFISRYLIVAMYFSAGLLPVYINITSLKLPGTFWVYILPGIVSIYELIIIRTFINEIPEDIEESALIDGANDVTIAFRIILPLCKPVIAAVLLFEFVNHWNSYMDTLLYNAYKPSLFTLQYALSNFLARQLNFTPTDFSSQMQSASYNPDSLKMAMTVVVCLPIMFVYPLLQKYFVKGILIGSVKG